MCFSWAQPEGPLGVELKGGLGGGHHKIGLRVCKFMCISNQKQ